MLLCLSSSTVRNQLLPLPLPWGGRALLTQGGIPFPRIRVHSLPTVCYTPLVWIRGVHFLWLFRPPPSPLWDCPHVPYYFLLFRDCDDCGWVVLLGPFLGPCFFMLGFSCWSLIGPPCSQWFDSRCILRLRSSNSLLLSYSIITILTLVSGLQPQNLFLLPAHLFLYGDD